MAKWHVKDGAEFVKEGEEVVIEKEGYLNGKRILDEEEDGADVAGVCPFSGVRRGMEGLKVGETNGGEAKVEA